jgi:large repetitive protein
MNRRGSIASLLSLILAALAMLLPAHTALAQAGAIQGVVYADRAAVEGASVVLVNETGPVARTLTNASGEFSFPRVAAGRYRLHAMKEGVGQGAAAVSLRAGQSISVRIALVSDQRDPGAISGITVNADGAIGGAQVILSRRGTVVARAESSEDGRFGFRNLAPGTYTLQAAKRGVGRGEAEVVVTAGEVSRIRVALRPVVVETGHIVGLVRTTDGQVVPGATVVLRDSTGEIARVLTDETGRYGFRNLRPGTYGLTASKRGVGEGSTRANVVAGQSVRAMIEIQPVARVGAVRGVTVSEAGVVGGATVTILNRGNVVATATSGRDGSFSFTNLNPGNYVIEAAKRGVGAGRVEIAVVAGETTTVRVPLR